MSLVHAFSIHARCRSVGVLDGTYVCMYVRERTRTDKGVVLSDHNITTHNRSYECGLWVVGRSVTSRKVALQNHTIVFSCNLKLQNDSR